MEIIRGFLGLIMLVGIAYLFSKHKKNINWKLVITGILIQFVLALLVFKQIQIPFTSISMSSIFSFLASFFTQLLSFTDAGAQFIFGSWPDSAEIFKLGSEGRVEHTIGYVFAFKVLPTVVFFYALT